MNFKIGDRVGFRSLVGVIVGMSGSSVRITTDPEKTDRIVKMSAIRHLDIWKDSPLYLEYRKKVESIWNCD